MFGENGYAFVHILNVVLVNLQYQLRGKSQLSSESPRIILVSMICQRRDVSLLPTCYKVFSKAICKRITPPPYPMRLHFGSVLSCQIVTDRN